MPTFPQKRREDFKFSLLFCTRKRHLTKIVGREGKPLIIPDDLDNIVYIFMNAHRRI